MTHPLTFETLLATGVQWLRYAVELTGAITIATGSVLVLTQIVQVALKSGTNDFDLIRLTLARYLALALEFQLGADILSTAIAPGWNEIGKLGAIAVIRTGLNYFLSKELAEVEPGLGSNDKRRS